MRVIIAVLLLLGGLIGLFMTACGGIVTVMSLGEIKRGGLQLFAICVPSMLGGLLLLRFVAGRYAKWRDAGPGAPPNMPPA
jgi:hypothetical protein